MSGLPDWHLSNPLSDYERQNMREHIVSILRKQKKDMPPEIIGRLPKLAARVEAKLLMEARSRAEYGNRFTLEARLRALTQRRDGRVGKRQRPPSSSMSDGEGSAGKDQKKRAMALHYQYQLNTNSDTGSGALVFQFSSDAVERATSTTSPTRATVPPLIPVPRNNSLGESLGLSSHSGHPLISKCYQLLDSLIYEKHTEVSSRAILEQLDEISNRRWILPKLREAVSHALVSAVHAARRIDPHESLNSSSPPNDDFHVINLAKVVRNNGSSSSTCDDPSMDNSDTPMGDAHQVRSEDMTGEHRPIDIDGGVPERELQLENSMPPPNVSVPKGGFVVASQVSNSAQRVSSTLNNTEANGMESSNSSIASAPVSLLLNFCAEHFTKSSPVHKGLMNSILLLYKGHSARTVDGRMSLPLFDQRSLQRCVDRFALSDPASAFQIVTRLVKQWPVNDSQGQVEYMEQIESLFRLSDIATCTKMISPVVHRVAKCCVHGNCTVALTAIGLAENVLSIAERIPPTIYGSNSPAAQARSSFVVLRKMLGQNRTHWHPAVVQSSEDLSKKLRIRLSFNGLPVQM